MKKAQMLDRLNALYSARKGTPHAKLESKQVLALFDLIYELISGEQQQLESDPVLAGAKKYIVVSFNGEYLNHTADDITRLTALVVEEYAQIVNTETGNIEHIFVEGKWQ